MNQEQNHDYASPSDKKGKLQKPSLAFAKRIVIKIGSSLLVDGTSGQLRKRWFARFIEEIADWRKAGKEIVIISSGAIALGRKNMPPESLKLHEAQAAAAIGQIALAQHYSHELAKYGLAAAQLLITLEDSERRRRYLNARNTFDTLLRYQAVPIVNENDTVATNEIRFGDNDRLAARVAVMIGADHLILLSEIDGLYTRDPTDCASGEKPDFVEIIHAITPEIKAMAGKNVSKMGSGGMITKLLAAEIATNAGCHVAVCFGGCDKPLGQLEKTDRASWFISHTTPFLARKRWIASTLVCLGKIVIDNGAKAALLVGKSLLPVGVLQVLGDFDRGDAVQIFDQADREIARGLSAYNSIDARRILGCKSEAIESLLGYRGRDVLIHRDDLVLLRKT